MAERNEKHNEAQPIEIQQIIERAVAQALQEQSPQLQAQIVQRLMFRLPERAELPAHAAQFVPAIVDFLAEPEPRRAR